MNDDKLQPKKPTVKHGAYRAMSECIRNAKADKHAQRIGSFTVIKVPDGYDYVCGDTPALFPFDRPLAQYYFLNGRVWSYPRQIKQGEQS